MFVRVAPLISHSQNMYTGQIPVPAYNDDGVRYLENFIPSVILANTQADMARLFLLADFYPNDSVIDNEKSALLIRARAQTILDLLPTDLAISDGLNNLCGTPEMAGAELRRASSTGSGESSGLRRGGSFGSRGRWSSMDSGDGGDGGDGGVTALSLKGFFAGRKASNPGYISYYKLQALSAKLLPAAVQEGGWYIYIRGGILVSGVVYLYPGWYICIRGGIFVSGVVYLYPGWYICIRGGIFISGVVYLYPGWYIYIRGCIFISGVVYLYPGWYICIRGGIFISGVVYLYPGWYICIRGGIFISGVVYLYPGWYIYIRGGIFVSGVNFPGVCSREASDVITKGLVTS